MMHLGLAYSAETSDSEAVAHQEPASGAVGRVLIFNSRKRPNRTRRAQRINIMNSSTTDKVKGTAKEVTGKIKEETGKAIGNRNLQDRGTTEKVAGKVERKVGEVKKVFGK
jgi:uncharacterized protein YjbJ (UPF0337 family)